MGLKIGLGRDLLPQHGGSKNKGVWGVEKSVARIEVRDV